MAYSPTEKEELLNRIFNDISEGSSLRSVLRQDGMPNRDTLIKKPVLGAEVVNKESYRCDNARKVNAKKKPHGYIYILAIKEFDLYKIGVSANPNRRIKDIRAVLPFESDLIFCEKFLEVYTIEEEIHELFKLNKFKKEWYQVYPKDIESLQLYLKELKQRQIKIINN